jgi:hypothetical protein
MYQIKTNQQANLETAKETTLEILDALNDL